MSQPGERIRAVAGLILFALACAAGVAAQQRATSTHSPHGPLNIACQNCHTFSGWKPIRSIPEFDHNKTKYPLRGMHEKVPCTSCHTKMVFSNVSTQCADCHADIHKRQFGANCEQCHTVKGWDVSIQQIQNHQNRFPLLGAHATLACDSCHKGAAVSKFESMPTACYSCHAKDYQATTAPNHAAAGFSTTCEQCHQFDNWLGVRFDHLKNTGYALTGAHATLACNACHVNNQFKGTPATCSGCHMPDFQKATNPNHVAANFPTTCQTCHNTTAWQPASFDHNSVGFPLTNGHANLQCTQCHVNNNYNLTSAACNTCHMPDYNGTTNPNHVQAGFPTTCQTCHNTVSWLQAAFDHTATGFPLTNGHANLQCAQCHVNNNYNLTSGACNLCHMPDYNGTTTPNHVQAGFPTTCQACHNTVSWLQAAFDHTTTGFPLTFGHANLQCAQCHVNNNYNLTSGACNLCHMPDYSGTNNPPHQAAGFPTTCQTCHNTVSWLQSAFDHTTTGFPLTNGHANLQCAQCHINKNYNLTSGACNLCHMPDYNSTTNPNHAQAGFPVDCSVCHTTVSWLTATFNHSTTGFPLTGFHVSVPCAQCHVNGNYNLTNTACSSCHMPDYNATNNPPHASVGFPNTCEVCHNTTSWLQATFNHNLTTFPLTGFHVTVPCAQCHVNNNYTTLPTACYGCHQADYQSTNNPNHAAAGFPTTCQTCHDTTSWLNATFNHTYFPMNHGGANGVCSTCHTNSADYTVFSCTQCHAKSQTDSNHQGVRNYVYNSINCYQCHPTGNGG